MDDEQIYIVECPNCHYKTQTRDYYRYFDFQIECEKCKKAEYWYIKETKVK